jgi:hypothetical protein
VSILIYLKSAKSITLIIFALLIGGNCLAGSSSNIERAKTGLDAYVKALQRGSVQEAKQYWNREEIKKYEIFDWQWDYLTFQGWNPSYLYYKITSAEEKNDYTILQVEWFYREGKSGTVQRDTRYFIEEDGAMVGANPVFIYSRGWLQKRSKHFVYHFKNKGDKPAFGLLERMDRFYEKTAGVLQVEYRDKIDYYKCSTADEVGSLFSMTPSLARSQVVNGVVASVQNFVPHEIVHVISYRMLPPDENRIPPVMLDEGLSYYLGGTSYFSTNLLLNWASEKLQADVEIRLDTLWANPWAYGGNESAGLEASFVKFLIETEGIGKFKELYADGDTREEPNQVLTKVYGIDFQQLQRDWKKYTATMKLPEVRTNDSKDATELFHVSDPVGDDKGNGYYTYPLNPRAKPGIFDLTDVQISLDSGWVYFHLQFSDLSHSEITSDTSFNGTFAAITMDTDHRKNSGNIQLFFGNGNFELSETDAYEFAIEVSNAGVLVYDQNWVWQLLFLKADSQSNHISGNAFSFAIPQEIIGRPDSSWRIQVLTGGETGGYRSTAMGVGSFIKVGQTSTPDQGGGCVESHLNPDIYDILTSQGKDQMRILGSYSEAKKKKAIIPMIRLNQMNYR